MPHSRKAWVVGFYENLYSVLFSPDCLCVEFWGHLTSVPRPPNCWHAVQSLTQGHCGIRGPRSRMPTISEVQSRESKVTGWMAFQFFKAGIPNLPAMDRCWSVA